MPLLLAILLYHQVIDERFAVRMVNVSKRWHFLKIILNEKF